jgi:hypothetical protein
MSENMSNPKSFMRGVARIYRMSTIDCMLWGYVAAQQEIDPKLSTTAAAQMFIDRFALNDEWDVTLAIQCIRRVNNSLRESGGKL